MKKSFSEIASVSVIVPLSLTGRRARMLHGSQNNAERVVEMLHQE
jgi:hypothetical protein